MLHQQITTVNYLLLISNIEFYIILKKSVPLDWKAIHFSVFSNIITVFFSVKNDSITFLAAPGVDPPALAGGCLTAGALAIVEPVDGRESVPSSNVGTVSGHFIIPSSFHKGDFELAEVIATAGHCWRILSSVFSR